ncbi:GtrA family protein [Prosthecomicrobium sp. N25]|uniref:GtrA family protein n=1 Tax=Prosthecomicrobium sp. N25 TaxID=3129254 RepID=UPI0030779DF3
MPALRSSMLLALSDQFLRYALVGIAAAIGHYGTLIGLVEGGFAGAVAASLAGFVVGGVISYMLNRRFTFASERSHAGAVPRFAVIAGAAFLMTGALMHALTAWAGIHYLVAQLVTTGIVLVWTFFANRFWTFRG